MNKKYQKAFFYMFLIITIIFIVIIVFLSSRYKTTQESYIHEGIQKLEIQMESTLTSFDSFSEYIYDTSINNDYVLERIETAYASDEAARDEIRDELYDYFIDDYTIMSSYDFRQFHFHFPDSTSFLRMHAPEKYGDSLFDLRYSIRTVNEYYTPVSGFEEGRIFNGYRFVYPLTRNDEHIGSVEVSVSMSSVINVLTSLNNKDYYFIMDRDIVEGSVFVEELENYEVSCLSPDFLIDIGTFENTERNIFSNDEFHFFFASIDDGQLDNLEDMKEMGFVHEYQGHEYEVYLYPVTNIEDQEVAYFISIEESSDYNLLATQFMYNIIFVIVVYILIVLAIYVNMDRIKSITKISLTDGLTNIDNRRKFHQDFEFELARMKRISINLGLIMIDIDHFKRINDEYGHDAGDKVLIELSQLIKCNIRREDNLSRFGGEEFMVMLIGADLTNSIDKAEELRKAVEDFEFSVDTKITISLGVFNINNPEIKYDNVIKNVDNALYQSKENGRNQVTSFNKIKTD